MKFLFRVDAYPEIALGHLSRCIQLAIALKKYTNSILFVVYEDCPLLEKLEKNQISYKLLPCKINTDPYEFLYLKDYQDYIFVIDSYNVDENYFKELSDTAFEIVYLDDLMIDYKNINLVINPSCYSTKKQYKNKDSLLGLDYLILSEEYKKGNHNEKNNVSKLMITMGGIDHYDLSTKLIKIVENLQLKLELNIIVGPYYSNIDSIFKAKENSPLTINIFTDLSSIENVISNSDIAVSAGGFSIFELACMSKPSIGISLWKNQSNNITCLGNHGAIIPMFFQDNDNFYKELEENIKQLVNKPLFRKGLSENCKIIDGSGTERIAKFLSKRYG